MTTPIGINNSMTNASSPQPSGIAAEAEKKPLKPGKGYGIAAMGCGLMSLFLLYYCATFPPIMDPWREMAGFLWPLCFVAAIVFGILGRKTQGEPYANVVLGFTRLIVFVLVFVVLVGFSIFFVTLTFFLWHFW